VSTEPAALGVIETPEPERRTRQSMPAGMRLAVVLIVAAVLCFAFVFWDIRGAFEYIVERRTTAVIGMVIVGAAVGTASVAFQTVTGNRILTPSIMGFDALFMLIQTALTFAVGSTALALWNVTGRFFAEMIAMVIVCMLLYTWLLVGARRSLQVVLLVGIVLSTLFRSISLFLQRIMDPNEYQVLQDTFFASFNSIQAEIVPVAGIIVAVACAGLWLLRNPLDVMGLGRDTAINLGVRHQRVTVWVLFLVSVLIAASTALVGPSTFLGLIVAHLAYQLAGSYRHAVLLPFVIGVTVITLVGGQFVMEHLLGFSTALSVIIEFVGGLLFIGLLLRRKGTT